MNDGATRPRRTSELRRKRSPTVGSEEERIGEWADFVYLRRGRVTHVKPHTETAAHPRVLCGRSPAWGGAWLGTGNHTEHDQARRMPLCARCTKTSGNRTR